MLKFELSIRIRKKGDLSDFRGDIVVGARVSKTQLSGSKCLVDVRGHGKSINHWLQPKYNFNQWKSTPGVTPAN